MELFFDDFIAIANGLISGGLLEYEKIPRNDENLHKFLYSAILIIRQMYIGDIIKMYSEKIKKEFSLSPADSIQISIIFLRKIMYTLKFIAEFFEIVEDSVASMQQTAFCEIKPIDHFKKMQILCKKTYEYTIFMFELKNTTEFDKNRLFVRNAIYDMDDFYTLYDRLYNEPSGTYGSP